MDTTAKHTCPAEVVRAGARLVALRRLAKRLEDAIDEALPDIQEGINCVVDKHGAAYVQAGEAKTLLRTAQTAAGLIMQAHNSLRLVLVERGIAEPTGDQIITLLAEASERKDKPGAEPDSIR